MSDFHFLRPEWFLAIFPLALFYWLLVKQQLSNKSWQSYCDPQLLPYLFESVPGKQKYRGLFLLLLSGLLIITALAGPSWEKKPQPVFKKQSALVIILDLSRSMDANDIKPSRLTRAIHKTEDILSLRKEGQTALIVFANNAFTVTPLTEDTQTISSQLKSLNTSIMPGQGSRPELALNMAYDLFMQTSLLHGHIILITDDLSTSSLKTINKQRQPAYSLSILGVGTSDGAPIPLSKGGFLKDKSGSIVVPKLNSALLQKISALSSYRTLSSSDADILKLLEPLNTLNSSDHKSTALNSDSWVEAGPWLLLLTLPFAAYAFRKGLLMLYLVILIPVPDQAHAFEWNQLWQNKNQQAQQLFNKNSHEAAADLFSDPEWKASAEYKAGNYEQALEIYQQLDLEKEDNRYNLANTQAQLGQYDKALENYNKLIESNPQHKDAIYNRDQIEKMQQQSNQQSSDQQQNQDKNSKDKKDESDSSSESGQNNNQDNKQQNSDSQPADEKQQESSEQDDKQLANDKQPSDEEKNQQQSSQQDQKNQEQESSTEKNSETQKESMPEQLSQEQKQANEQWLRKIPDDPGGLLRRKFQYQTQQRPNNNNGNDQW